MAGVLKDLCKRLHGGLDKVKNFCYICARKTKAKNKKGYGLCQI